MRDIEDIIEKKVLPQTPCVACVVDNAIVIDCSQDCECYDVDVTEDINSISFVNCEGVDPCINFHVPPNTTRGICGFPQGGSGPFTQFSGDECVTNPIPGGTDGRTVGTGSKPPNSKPGSGKPGGGVGGTTCECVPGKKAELTVKCCSDDCSMNCSSSKKLVIKICGGTPPYSIAGSSGLGFTKAGGATITSGITAGQSITINPPANTGSGVSGNAYRRCMQGYSGPSAGFCTCGLLRCLHGCNDQFIGTAASGTCAGDIPTTHANFAGLNPICNPNGSAPNCEAVITPVLVTDAAMCAATSKGSVNDIRTAQMITDGCNPCALSVQSKTFTVTDAAGVSVVTSLSS
jgi:hypothetical protein